MIFLFKKYQKKQFFNKKTKKMNFWDNVFGKQNKIEEKAIDWKLLQTETDLTNLIDKSVERPQIIFKHSTRCSISSMAKTRLERHWNIENADIHYLDLIAFRPVSNKIAEFFNVTHQSPQVIIVKEGQAIFDTSHNDIDVESIKKHL